MAMFSIMSSSFVSLIVLFFLFGKRTHAIVQDIIYGFRYFIDTHIEFEGVVDVTRGNTDVVLLKYKTR